MDSTSNQQMPQNLTGDNKNNAPVDTTERMFYRHPVIDRYAKGSDMSKLFSDQHRIETWRRLWVTLARMQKQLGLPEVSDDQIRVLEANIGEIDWSAAQAEEKRVRHDVMAHVRTFGATCEKAAPSAGAEKIIHLGATSAYVQDNTDLILMRDGITLLLPKVARCMDRLSRFAEKYRALPTLAFTHLQPAQPTTVGKRASLWLLDLLMDLQALERVRDELKFRGVKGTTGTQATFLQLFKDDHGKVRELDKLVTEAFGFKASYPVCGQTYSRKVDNEIIFTLANLACTVKKVCTDLRHLAFMKEIEEPFESEQIGSSAMAYKRNPMRSERCCGLARFVINLVGNPLDTYCDQWFERTLDDSSNRRMVIPEAFCVTDVMLNTFQNVVEGLVVYEQMIRANLDRELPFMATEYIIAAMVERGGDRQQVHEELRKISHASAARVKLEGKSNDFVERVLANEFFEPVHKDLHAIIDAKQFIGRAPEQVDEFLREHVHEALKPFAENKELMSIKGRVEV